MQRLATIMVSSVLSGVAAVHAAVITPVGVASTSRFNDPSITPECLIDGSGLSGVGPVENQTHSGAIGEYNFWNAGSVDGGLGGPTGSPPTVDSQAVVFDLGYAYSLTGAYIWNHSRSTLFSRGVNQFKVWVSSDTNMTTATWTQVGGTYNLAIATSAVAQAAQFVGLGSVANVRLVKLDIDSAHSGSASDYVGLNEVRFAVVPPDFAAAAIAPVGVAATSTENDARIRPEQLIDGSGLSGVGPVENQIHSGGIEEWNFWGAGPVDGGLGGPTGTPPVVDSQAVVFDLGYAYSLTGAYIWSHSRDTLFSRGVNRFKLWVSSDTNMTTAAWTRVNGTYYLAKATSSVAQAAQFIGPIPPVGNVRLVKIDIDSAHSGLASDYVGLNEVRFAVVPPEVVDVVITPVGAAATSRFDASVITPECLIDGSGLSGVGPVEHQTHSGGIAEWNFWQAGSVDGGLGGPTGNPPVVDSQAVAFDLGYPYSLTGAYVWNHSRNTLFSRGVNRFKLWVSSDTNMTTAAWTQVYGTYYLAKATSSVAQAAQFIGPIPPVGNVRLVKIDIDSAHSGYASDDVSLNEVRFGVAPPPRGTIVILN
ncbi:MAG: hypothetical protein PHR35_09895 [Kiritimatiellae bacterium]|nr:hypothetical protein [Kiritimatiellia bacterium]